MNSFSGNEQNHLFLQANGNFLDASAVSGIDFRQDGRGFGLLDYDRDGWLDLAIVSPQKPAFRIIRNRAHRDSSEKNRQPKRHSAFIKLQGNHSGTESTNQWSPRDPFGAEVRVTIDGVTRAFLFCGGQGLSSQNSKWLHIGMASHDKIDNVEVIWPSGKKTTHAGPQSGQRLILSESSGQQVD